jgi:hypothetical protein
MASRFQQRALARKVIYLALILVLLTVSLMHRRLVVLPQANYLQLREETRGQVELTTSAVRHIMTGMRGWATCWLWLESIEKTKKHEWNQVELLVRTITKLQPYYVQPWLYQCWHLSFNVAVEFERVRDKYFYISRGIELLSEGERRNQGSEVQGAGDTRRIHFPGDPMMRYYVGDFYLLKIGGGDDEDAMRCLFDMSCMDPAERDPESLLAAGQSGQEVDLDKFEKFCKKYPRLVRRLRESKLGCESPRDVVAFLRDNQDLPTRYEKPQFTPGAEHHTRLKPVNERFPILPPRSSDVLGPQSAKDRDLNDDIPADEDFDVYGAARLWFAYAQEPLPPPNPNPGVNDEDFNRKYYDPLLHRMPQMMNQIFRSYPARCQFFHAEKLEADGWFDDGWLVRKWFDAGQGAEVRVGTETRYQAGPAAAGAHRMYKLYGEENGMLITPEQRSALLAKAMPYLRKHQVSYGKVPDVLSKADQDAGLGSSLDAAKKLKYSDFYRTATNFDMFYHQTRAEALPEVVAARKAFFQAERLRREEAAPEQALLLYEATLPRWLDILLANPDFARIDETQEQTYEAQMHYIRLLQGQRDTVLKPLVTVMAQFALRPHMPLYKANTYSDEQTKIIPIRKVRGPFEMVYLYDQPNLAPLKAAVVELTQGAIRSPLPMPPALKTWITSHTFVVVKPRGPEQRKTLIGWRPLITDDVITLVRMRLGITRATDDVPPTPRPRNPRVRGR